MKQNRSVFALLLALVLLASSSFSQGEKLPPINIKEVKLKNGLTVLLHQDHSVPTVAVNVWYHVGSKNEAPGRTGFAHLFEHMMFQGSKNWVDSYRAIDEIAPANGTTDEDRTYYWEPIPANYLERTLYIEADRMGYLLDAMDQAKLDNQRDVVKNERRQRVDNQAYGAAEDLIPEIMYPQGHPYHHSVIGSMSDLSAASLDDVKSFFRQYYVPNNAFLVISGDIDEKQTLKWVHKYFDKIKKGAPIQRPHTPQPQLSGVVRKQIEDPFATLSAVNLVWPGVAAYSADDAALSILGSVLSGGRGSRLQSDLVFGKRLATQVTARNSSSEIGGLFEIRATAAPGRSLDEIEKEINTEVERLKADGPTADEINRAINGREFQAITGLQTALGKGGRIAEYAGYVGNPNYFQADLDRYVRVTPADVKRVANQYLVANHLVLSFVPATSKPAPAQIDKPASTESKKLDPALIAKQEAMLPKVGPNPKFSLPAIDKSKLSNGLDLWVVQRHELPIVAMDLVLNAGGSLDSADRAGVASLTAAMLNQGTKTRSAVEISNGLQSIGALLGASASWDSATVSMQTLTKNLDKALDFYADVIVNPTFNANEFDSLKQRALNGFRARKAQSGAVAGLVYDKVLYGDQPYGRQLSGDEKTVRAASRDDLVKFYESYYRPNNSTLIVVGDVQPAEIKAKLEGAFSSWKAGGKEPTPLAEQRMVGKPGIYLVDKPGAAQSSISIGEVAIDRNHPDYYAVQVMNAILGGGLTGRLDKNLREDKGYTYGAGSRFTYRRAAGPFTASGDVQTGSTKESVVEFLKEINGMRGAIPITPAELEVGKQNFIRRFPSNFETLSGISNQLAGLVTYGLPGTYFNDYLAKVDAVTLADVNRVANKYLDSSKMAIVVVGDRAVIEPKLKELGMPITVLDTEGNPVTGKPSSQP